MASDQDDEDEHTHEHICGKCDSTFSTEEELQTHAREEHDVDV